MGTIFLSYSRSESLDFARELRRRFVRDGIECFFDETSIEWGDNFVLALEKGLDDCDHIIVVLSPGFINSEWTTLERTSTQVDDPANLKHKFLPLLHRPCEFPRFLKPVQYLDVSTTELLNTHYPTICKKLGGTLKPDAPELDLTTSEMPPVAQLPLRHRMPYRSLGPRFSGRVQPLLDLHKLLLKSNGIAVVEGVGVVVGTGGLGKTQLAIEYVHRLGSHYPGGVFWINADQPLSNALEELATAAEIELDGSLPDQQKAEVLWRGLAKYSAAVLIVYDNFPENTPIRPWLPVSSVQIKTLVTTRRRDLDQPKIELSFMNEDEALQVLNSRERQFDQESRPLIEALGGLPLALELTCHYLNRRRTLSIKKLLEEMDTIGELAALDIFADKYSQELPSSHEKAISATLQISWQQASTVAQTLLTLMAWWAPAPVPRRLLHRAMECNAHNVLDDPVENAISELAQLSLVELDEDYDPYLHRLLRGFVRVVADQEENKDTALSALTKELKRASDDSDTAALNELEKVLPHGQSVMDEALGEVDQFIPIANYIGWHQRRRGRYQLARQSRARALAAAEQHYEPGHPTIARSQSNLALVLQDLGDYEGAREFLEKALAANEQHYEPGHPTIATRQSNLAMVLQGLGDYEGARKLLEKALAADEQHYEPGHPTIAIRQSNLGSVLQDLGDYEGAREFLEKALAAAEQHYEPGHPTIARSQSNLALVLKDLGDYEGARELHVKALAAEEQHYEPGHPTIAIRQSNLALALQGLGDYEGARELLENALAAEEQHYEPGHPTIAISQSNLALVLQDLGDYEGARELREKALAAAEQRYEPGHPTIATRQSNLALVLQDLGDYEGARELHVKELAAEEQHYEPGHPTIAISQSNLALALQGLGDYEGAKELLEKALAAEEQHYEPGHPTIAISQSNLALVLQDLGDYEGARELREKVLAAAEQRYEPGHPTIAIYRTNLEGILKLLEK